MAGFDSIWLDAVHTLERGDPFALATVVNVRGSTPREVGAKMIVHKNGQSGTIGGGCGEAEVFRKAQVLLQEEGGARMAEVDLTGDFDQREIGTCGGIMDVFISRWTPARDLDLARRLAGAAERGVAGALISVVDPGAAGEAPAGAHAFVAAGAAFESATAPGIPALVLDRIRGQILDGVPCLLGLDGEGIPRPVGRIGPNGAARIFVDPVIGVERLIVVGAGHIAVPLCDIGAATGFRVTVIDDRASFANRERFPKAAEIIVAPFVSAIESLALDSRCRLVSVTRGHSFDEEVVRAALMSPCGFVGMIGSRRRVAATIERLAALGVPPMRLEALHAPLGLAIGAQTPEEIAVSIVAELIRERRTGERDEMTLGVRLGKLSRQP
ncbi:MAG TPA: XdhC family protein [Candidatus Binataceae bacterium]|nr:XdhC family protein [Candidatus Binataceae bacterium]